MPQATPKTRIAVHKFSSCDGCQLALLNSVPAILALADRIEIVHFAEAGPWLTVSPETQVMPTATIGTMSPVR